MKCSMFSDFFRGRGKTPPPAENVAAKDESSSAIKGTLYDESSIDEILSGTSEQTRENIMRTMRHLDREESMKLLSPGYLDCLREIGDIPEISDLFSLLCSPVVSPKIKHSIVDPIVKTNFQIF
jgi:hypothetical protein